MYNVICLYFVTIKCYYEKQIIHFLFSGGKN